MNITVKFDEAALRRQIGSQVNNAVAQLARDHTAGLATLRQRYQGQSVEVIKPALIAQFKRTGGNITEPQLTQWAQMISDGQPIVIQPGKGW